MRGVLLTGPQQTHAKGAIRLEKQFVSQWIIAGYPSQEGVKTLDCLLPLRDYPHPCTRVKTEGE